MFGQTNFGIENTLEAGIEKRYGKYRGLVTNVDDPAKMGRIKAKIPKLLGNYDCNWAMPCVPFAGDSHGIQFLPQIGDGVWIEFENGDPNKPIWVGFWWKPETLPTSLKGSYQPGNRYIWLPDGSYIEFDCATHTLNIHTDAKVSVTSPYTEVVSDQIVLAGGGPAVARVGDSIVGVCPHGGVTGSISSGSSKVTSG
jgi:phage baseplate assembly protein gpV